MALKPFYDTPNANTVGEASPTHYQATHNFAPAAQSPRTTVGYAAEPHQPRQRAVRVRRTASPVRTPILRRRTHGSQFRRAAEDLRARFRLTMSASWDCHQIIFHSSVTRRSRLRERYLRHNRRCTFGSCVCFGAAASTRWCVAAANQRRRAGHRRQTPKPSRARTTTVQAIILYLTERQAA